MRITRNELSRIRVKLGIEDVMEHVRKIVLDVRNKGDDALRRYTEILDKVKLNNIEVSREELREASSRLDNLKSAIDASIDSVREFYESIMPKNTWGDYEGLVRELAWVPIHRVGIYVPRNYFSTLIMVGTVARVAGVEEIIVTTPPLSDASVSPAMAYVALKLGVKLFRVGGPQAIAAMAFGTETVPRVDKIVGPGNVYVQAAKLLVSPYVGIDGIEGPTELVACADPSVDPEIVALDLASQLEHPSALGLVVSWDEDYLAKIEGHLDKLTGGGYYSMLVSSPRECIDVINELSPEHVSLWGVEDLGVKNAGIISMNTPSAVVDYVAGPSHVLPTGGSARWRGIMTPMDFMKPIAKVRANRGSRLLKLGSEIGLSEGFRLHAESLRRYMRT